ncbi:MAG: DinB family protein [Pseudomonadota bacterium]
MSTPQLYQTFSEYNIWMNGRLYAVCGELDDAARKADRGAFFGSIHSSLNHVLFGDRAWMGRFTGRDYGVKPIGQDLYEDFDALKAARLEMDDEIKSWTTSLDVDWLTQDFVWKSGIDGKTRRQPTWVLVSHMFNHQTHHRGQVTTLLSQLGKDIGSTDLPWGPYMQPDGG